MSLEKALILIFFLVFVLGVSSSPVDTAKQKRVPRHQEINNLNSQTDIQNDRANRSNENERNISEKGKVYEERTPEKDLDKVSESPAKFIYSRRLPTKPIEKIVIENPPHLSVEVKNLDIVKRLKRSPAIIRFLPSNDNEVVLSIERFKRHLPQVVLNPKIFEKESDKKHKRHLQNFPAQYEHVDKTLQSPEAHKVIYKTRERAKRYPQMFVLKSDLDETRDDAPGPRQSHIRTAEPYNPADDSNEQKPTRIFKTDELVNGSSKMAIPFNEPTRPAVRPTNPLKPGRHSFEAPGNSKPIDYELVKPTAARGSLRGLGLPPTANCIACTNQYHNHDPYSQSGRIGQYYGQSVPRYTSVEMYPGSVHSYYPAGNFYVNRRFGVSRHPSQIEGRGMVEYASNDRNEYPLAEPEP